LVVPRSMPMILPMSIAPNVGWRAFEAARCLCLCSYLRRQVGFSRGVFDFFAPSSNLSPDF
jgi:hypothetical protein